MRFSVFLFVFALCVFAAFPAHAKTKNVSVISFVPAVDGGKFITQYQSQTLRQWGYNFGATFDYAYEPYEMGSGGTRTGHIVDDLLVGNFFGAVGFTDWWNAGVNLPVALWETYYDPTLVTPAKETFNGKLGDLSVEMKFRLLDIERHHVGLSIMPYMYFPTGDSNVNLGNGMWSPGGTIVFDADIINRVFLTLNLGYRYYDYVRFNTFDTRAKLDDTLTLGGGINVRITDSWAALGEIWSWSTVSNFFSNALMSPTQFLVGGRFTPQGRIKGMTFTAAVGRGITNGVGCPDWRAVLGVSFRHVYIPPPPPPVDVEAQVEEKIIITQKIHFEFNKSVIRPISYPILDDVVALLGQNPQITLVRVEGHTDWIGSDAANQKLSERRARAVRDYLVKKGIEPSRLESAGYGESRPIADNNTVQGRARNRRTEFTVVKW